jgi:hypothetical protein
MKMKGWPVSISYELEPNCINVVHGQVARRQLSASSFRKYFIVGIRADFRPFPYGQFEIVQNKHSEGKNCIYMPHFPQPGLLARASDRKGVVNVCFSGRMQNSGIDPDQFSTDLEAMGCHFVFKGEGQWQEMQDVDLLVGIRSLSKEPHHTKPPTKLFNAWLAGIPFIGGYDSAYEQVGIPGENYLRVASYEELLEAIKRLRDDVQLYCNMVDEGLCAGAGYGAEKTAERWESFFKEQVCPTYRLWKQGSMRARMKGQCISAQFFMQEGVLTLARRLSRKVRRKGGG